MPLQRQLLIGGARWVVFRVNVPVPSPPVHEELRDGWLCFESEVERRRFAPVPAGWDALHDEELIALITARPRFAAFRTRAAISL